MTCPRCQAELREDSLVCDRCGSPVPEPATAQAARPRGSGGPASLFAGRYRLIDEVGRGGMGVVYRAEDVMLKRQVALKFLSVELADEPVARARFLREAQAAAALDSPHVCPVYEAGEADGRAFITMAFIEGPTLRGRLAAGPLGLEEAHLLSRQIAEGLAEAHKRGITHRDIKPANIMLAGGQNAKITDFGLARIQGSGETTRTAGVAGTLAYMSPEQAQGLDTDVRTDVWALGCVVYEMLTGRTPFSSDAGAVDLHALLSGNPRPIRECRPDASPEFEAVVDRCLRKNPQERYADAEGLLRDLRLVRPGGLLAPVAGPVRRGTPSLAVLPFTDMSPERSQGYFAEGIAEELIHALTRIQGLRVVARTSAFAVKDKGLDVREIGRVLDVGAVLEGSVRAAGGKLRITAQLIDVADGFHLWSERFDRDAGDIFAIQDDLSASIVEHLKVTLHVGEREAIRQRPTADHDAYDLYLRGLYLLARPRPDTLKAALQHFQDALRLDPAFAKAHAGVAGVYGTLATLNFTKPTESWPAAKAAVARALALDDHLAEAHGWAANAAFWYDWDWVAAEAGFNRVLALNPGDAFTHGSYAWFLLNRRRIPESLREITVAVSLDPLMPLFCAWSVGLHAAIGRYDEALKMFARAVEIDPGFGLPYFHASLAYLGKGMLDEAVRTLQAGSAIAPHPGWGDSVLAYIRLRRGDPDGARRILDRMIASREQAHTSPVTIAWVCSALDRMDEALSWLDRAIEERDSLVVFLHIYTGWISPTLAKDPRFGARLERLGLADLDAPAISPR